MSETYEEVIHGEPAYRRAPPAAHEILVNRLHALVARHLPAAAPLQQLPPRASLQLADDCILRPDLTIIRTDPALAGPAQLYLVAEVLFPGDHHLDTVIKKQLWSELRLPRLWMVDPRYLNVEVYGLGEYGFTLTDILAHHHPLTDPHLPGLDCSMEELFAKL
ncbi:MAG: Uma2 family endonuclease [Opitutae bacterium]|nr:Uma2 family endonuclease [Opitutae bacterium]